MAESSVLARTATLTFTPELPGEARHELDVQTLGPGLEWCT